MNLYKRPLFMQQGGAPGIQMPPPPAAMRPVAAPSGAMPPMPPTRAPMKPMAPPAAPMAAPMAASPASGQKDVAGIASMISNKSKIDINEAQGPEQLINAFRGNQKPLQARYQELAEYVGPQDATATPVSVLTMVQPSLMMTAKGAADSGIGELMANVAGKINMESSPGQPNRMGQGLGNLMMSNQAPQPAGMAQGGVVGKFAEGGNPLVEYYEQDLPAFQEILAPSQGDKDAAKRQLFFDIAQRGLAMAGGAGGTGNVASQLANVFQTLPGTYAAQQAELRKGERAAQQAALQSASGRVGADRAQQAKLAEIAEESRLRGLENQQAYNLKILELREQAKLEGRDADIYQYISENGEILSQPFDMSNPKDRERALTLGNVVKGVLRPADETSGLFGAGTSPDIKRVKNPDGSVETFNLSIRSQAAAYTTAMQAGGQEVDIEVPDVESPDIKRVQKPDGSVETFNLSNPLQAAAYTAAMQAGGQEVDIEVPDVEVPELTPSQREGVFADRGLLDKISNGTATPEELTRLNAAITAKTGMKFIGTNTFQNGVEVTRQVPGERLPDEWNAAIQQANQRGLNIQLPPYLSQTQPDVGDAQATNPLFADYDAQVGTGQPLSLTEIQNAALPDLSDQPSGIESAVMEYPIEKVFGTWASLDRTWNTYGPAVLGLLGPQAAAAAGPEQSEANAEQGLNAFHTLVVESMLAARPGRASNESRQILRELLPNINEARTNKADALGKYQSLQGEMTTDLRRVEGFLSQPLSQSDYQKYDFIRREISDRLGELNTIVTQLRGSTPASNRTPTSSFDDIFKATTRVPYTPQ